MKRVQDQVYYQVRELVLIRFSREVRSYGVYHLVQDQVLKQVWGQIFDQITNQIWDQIECETSP